MMQLLLALSLSAAAADLPGVELKFDVDPKGRWVLTADLPARYTQLGVQPGWALASVDGVRFQDAEAARRRVASGPARQVQLAFDTPAGETLLVVPRVDLVQVEELGLLPWPEGFAADNVAWIEGGGPQPLLRDASGTHWALDTGSGALQRTGAPAAEATLRLIPEVWWSLAEAPWVLASPNALSVSRAEGVRSTLTPATRLRRFQGRTGDHLAVPGPKGLDLYAVTWPRGTPELPECVSEVPETCLVAGRQIASDLMARKGGPEEALRVLGLACKGGVYRACLEALSLEHPDLAVRAEACIEQKANACHEVARTRLLSEPGAPGPVLLGVLEYACSVDASGSLGERLRRMENVGDGCMMLSSAFDRLAVSDRALLSLDQACMLGRADACTEASTRRKNAFALKTVRECENDELPLGPACTQLGRLLQEAPVAATKLDDFDAFLRGCKLGDEDACVLLGDYVDRWGIGHPRVIAAEQTLGAACDRGEQKACVGLAHLLVRHEPRAEAYGKALGLFDAACAKGLASACIAGARQRRVGKARKVEANDPLTMWQMACELHSALGCAGLGERLVRSRKTWDAAYTAWNRACETGEASACTDLGQLVANKHEPPWPAEQPARSYLERGCENADAEGCYWLASSDVPKRGDPPESAYLLLKRSCDGEYAKACAELGRIHLQRDTSFDFEIAAGRLQAACDNGHFESCRILSEMYGKGRGVERDRLKARELAQRYALNARRHHVRLGAHLGFPYIAGGEGELVAPIPAGPAFSVTGSYSYLPGLGGVMVQLVGETYPEVGPDLVYYDAGLRLYPNNKARGLYGMVGVHRIVAQNGQLTEPLVREGFSARMGMYSETRLIFTRVEMGIAQYGMIHLSDFDEDETSSFPLIQATLGFSVGLAIL
jgi:TPR repeat protein